MRHVILLRGVNVGGHGRITMSDLRERLAAGGLEDVRTHLQSGNAVVSAPDGAEVDEIAAAALRLWLGKAPTFFAMSRAAFSERLATCPYTASDPSRVIGLFHERGDPDAARLDALAAPAERWHAAPGVLWLLCPDGLGRSRLAAGAERAIGGPATGRNLRTLRVLAEMASA